MAAAQARWFERLNYTSPDFAGARWSRPAELGFLLSCCATGDPQDEDSPRAELDWSWIEAAARRHGVLPLVAKRLAEARAPCDHEATAAKLIKSATVNQLRNQYSTARLITLLEQFADASIPALTIKGPLLAKLAYNDIALRSFADLDILIRAVDIRAAARLLVRNGLIAENYDDEAVAANFFCAAEASFHTRDRTVRIDLHWRLSPPYYQFGPDSDELWARAREETLENSIVRTLAPEDNLLYLAVHASRHGWPALSHVCDIAHFVNRAKLDWEILLKRAQVTGSRLMLTVGLLLAGKLCALEIPGSVIERWEGERDAFCKADLLAGKIARRLFRRERPARLWLDSIRVIEGWSNRVRYLAVSSAQPTLIDWQWLQLPCRWYTAYYTIRPLRILAVMARRGMGQILKIFRGAGSRQYLLYHLRFDSQLLAKSRGEAPSLGGDESGETGLGKLAE